MNKQIEKHGDFIKHRDGRLDTTKDYWKKEIERFEKKKELSEEKLKKLREK